MHTLRVVIDDRSYTARIEGGVHATLSAFQDKIRRGTVDRLRLTDGQEILVNWGSVTTVRVRGADEDDD
jgi:hypothetical protein